MEFSLPKIHDFVLSNGLKVICYNVHDNPIVCIQAVIKTGSASETEGFLGCSHFIEHLVFKRTIRFPDNDLSEYATSIGASLNAYTDFDSTCYYLTLPSENINNGIMLISELLRYSVFNSEDIETEKSIIIEEIKQYETDPESFFIEKVQESYFIEGPMKRPILGTMDDIKQISLDIITDYYNRNYIPSNCFISICGQYDLELVKESITNYFFNWSNTNLPNKPTNIYELPKSFTQKHHVFYSDNCGDYLAVCLPELPENHELTNYFQIAIKYLAIGNTSVLHTRLIEDTKLCSSIKVHSLSGLLPGVSVIAINPIKRSKIPLIIDIINRELSAIMCQSIPIFEFDLLKRDLLYDWYYSFENMEDLAALICSEELYGSYASLYQYPDKLNTLDHSMLTQLLALYWTSRDISVCYMGSSRHVNNLIRDLVIEFGTSLVNCHTEKFDDQHLISYNTSLNSAFSEEFYLVGDNLYMSQMPNGINILYYQRERCFATGYALTTKLSQLYETSSERGYNYFASNASLYGSTQYDVNQIRQFSRYHGLSLSVNNNIDCTSWRGKCCNQSIHQAIQLLSDLVIKPALSDKSIEILKAATIDQELREKDYPASWGYSLWIKMMLGHNNIEKCHGNVSSIKKIVPSLVRNWYYEYMSQCNLSLCIVGNHKPSTIHTMLNDNFQAFVNKQSRLPRVNITQSNRKPGTIIYQRNLEQSIIHVGSYGPPSEMQEDLSAFNLLTHIIGGEISSRFYTIIREKYGLAYQIGMDYNSISGFGYWCAYSYCNIFDRSLMLDLMLSIIADVHSIGVTSKELSDSKTYMKSVYRSEQDNPSWVAANISILDSLNYPVSHYFDREKRIDSIDLETINNVASKWLNPNNLYIHIME